jgi:hypothetical protein
VKVDRRRVDAALSVLIVIEERIIFESEAPQIGRDDLIAHKTSRYLAWNRAWWISNALYRHIVEPRNALTV